MAVSSPIRTRGNPKPKKRLIGSRNISFAVLPEKISNLIIFLPPFRLLQKHPQIIVILPFNVRIVSHKSLLASTSSPKVGSSRKSICGSLISAIAILNLRCQPPDSLSAFLFKIADKPNCSESSLIFDRFMDILPIIFTFSGGNVALEYHDFRQIPAYHTLISSSKCRYFFVHLGDIIAWSKGNVNQNLP